MMKKREEHCIADSRYMNMTHLGGRSRVPSPESSRRPESRSSIEKAFSISAFFSHTFNFYYDAYYDGNNLGYVKMMTVLAYIRYCL